MLTDKKEPIKIIRFIPISEDSCWEKGKSYIFKCRAHFNNETQTIDIDMVFENDREKEEYLEFDKNRKNGIEYFSEIEGL